MSFRFALNTVCFLAIAAPVSAQSSAPTSQQASKPVKEKLICRRDVATGSIMAKSTCHTRAELDQIEARAKSDLGKVRDLEMTRAQVGVAR